MDRDGDVVSEGRAPQPAGGVRVEALARAWAAAYAERRDDDLLALVHQDIVLQPRRGQAAPEYHGIDGVRNWLADINGSAARPQFEGLTVGTLADGRAIAEATIGGAQLVTLFEMRDGLLVRVAVYLSDRAMLEQLGVI